MNATEAHALPAPTSNHASVDSVASVARDSLVRPDIRPPPTCAQSRFEPTLPARTHPEDRAARWTSTAAGHARNFTRQPTLAGAVHGSVPSPPVPPVPALSQVQIDSLLGPVDTDRSESLTGVMVTSADGRATADGRVGALTAPVDQAVLLAMRERSDAILIGAATARAEGYGALLSGPAAARRQAAGLAPQPTLCILATTAGSLAGAPALSGPFPSIVCAQACGEEADCIRVPAAESGRPDLARLLRELRRRGLRRISCEGGPTVLRILLEQRLLTHLVLAVAPRIVGGPGDPIVAGGSRLAVELRLAGSLAAEDYAFLRYDIVSL